MNHKCVVVEESADVWVGFGDGKCEKPFKTKEKVYY